MISLNVGIIYLWGIILNYVTSYYRLQGETTLTRESGGIVLPLAFFMGACSTPFSTSFMGLVGTRAAIFIIGFVYALVIYISSFMPNMILFVVFYAIIGGFCHSPLYLISLVHCYKFIKVKSLASGFIAAGVGFGTLVISVILVNPIINPNNIKA